MVVASHQLPRGVFVSSDATSHHTGAIDLCTSQSVHEHTISEAPTATKDVRAVENIDSPRADQVGHGVLRYEVHLKIQGHAKLPVRRRTQDATGRLGIQGFPDCRRVCGAVHVSRTAPAIAAAGGCIQGLTTASVGEEIGHT